MKSVGVVTFAALALLTGCSSSEKPSGIPVPPKWQGAPYHIAFDTKPAKPDPAGITIPTVTWNANPNELEKRAILVVRFDTSGAKTDQQVMDQMVMGAIDISGAQGALPADYMDAADKGLGQLLTAYHMSGKIKVSVLLARSSLSSQAGDGEIDAKRLSDWLPTELPFKGAHH
jgi:hypothetical protein